MPASVPGAAEFAYPIAELEQAQRLRAVIDDLHPDAPVTVVGAGLTGIEAATELAEKGHNVTLVCGGQLGPYLSEPGRRSVAKVLRKLGVKVLETDLVTEVRPDAVVFEDGAARQSAVTIWVAGFGVPDLAATSGLRTDAMGRLLTDETLTSVDDPRVVAAGDCASPSGVPLRMGCQSASPLGAQAANTVLSRIAYTPPAVIDQAFSGACISLGRKSGTPAVRPQRRHGRERLLQRPRRRLDQGGGVQGHAVGAAPRGGQAGFGVLVQGWASPRAVGIRPDDGLGRRHDPAGHQPIVTSTTPGPKLSHSGYARCLEVRPVQRRAG